MLKKTAPALGIFLLLILSVSVYANQRITKVGIIDMDRVKITFIDKSKDYTDYEKYRKEFDAKVAAITAKIDGMQAQKLEAKENGNEALALKLDNSILTENEYLKEYYRIAKNEIKIILQKINTGDDFYLKLKKAIALVAEEDGYSMVLDISTNPVLYWASDIDVTDRVIKTLSKMYETR